ncbi:MAG: TetR/AcrR family transcriptional regulator [Treponema sp.]|nr:TetR/AcrR family transcriptional regulator [Treponema sp.]
MRNANSQIIPLIKQKTLELLMQSDPAQIGMREIAKNCGITATNIYHYYKDKDTLFQAISLDCIRALNEKIKNAATKGKNTKNQVKNAIQVFCSWCFENPRMALLVMQGIKSAENVSPEIMEEYYICNRTGEQLLRKAIAEGAAHSKNPRLDIGLLVSGVWGCIEAVLLKKCDVEYWENGKKFTDAFITLWLNSIFGDEK